MLSGLFIAGVDTGVGKTLVCGLLANYLLNRGHRVITQKWVQTGCVSLAEDLKTHHQLSGIPHDRSLESLQNPYCFQLAASPHLAAEAAGEVLDPTRIISAYRELEKQFDVILVEGAGGLLVPLTREQLMIELIAELALPVLLVVSNRLGCINHALLSIAELKRRNIPLAAVVFNTLPGEKTDPRICADNPRVISQLGALTLYTELPVLTETKTGVNLLHKLGEKLAVDLKWEHNE